MLSRARRAPAAFLTAQEGCDKFCAFCVVPYTRGAEVSRPAARLLAEARDLVARGVVELTLLGQNVNAYRDADGVTLAGLVRALARIDGLERLRYTTSHPNDMGADLIAAHAEEEKLMPFLHLPVQSGSDRVLKAMNRRHTAEGYLALIDRIRAARPDMALSGDFIVGFPGETEADFQATLDLAAAVGYAQAYSFVYSPRPGTPAAGRAGSRRGDQVGTPAAPPGAAHPPADGVPGEHGRARAAGAAGKARARPRAAGGKVAVPQRRASAGRREPDRPSGDSAHQRGRHELAFRRNCRLRLNSRVYPRCLRRWRGWGSVW